MHHLDVGGVRLVPLGIEPARHRKPQLWGEAVQLVLWFQKNVNWWVGDCIVHAEDRCGPEFWQFLESQGISEKMMSRYAGVSRKVPFENRRENLSWTHHAIVANTEYRDQRKLLKAAEDEGMDTNEFREHVSHWRRRCRER